MAHQKCGTPIGLKDKNPQKIKEQIIKLALLRKKIRR
jgi:hypothetical protein